jgi:hypothetical protein
MAKPGKSRFFDRRKRKAVVVEAPAAPDIEDPRRSRDAAWRFLEILDDSRNQKPASA